MAGAGESTGAMRALLANVKVVDFEMLNTLGDAPHYAQSSAGYGAVVDDFNEPPYYPSAFPTAPP